MRFTSLALIPTLFAGFSFVARADLQPAPDPEIAIDAAGFSSPIGFGPCPVQPFPNATGGGICDFVNDTGSTLTELGFADSVNVPGLLTGSETGHYGPFTCDPAAYFSQCLIYFQAPGASPFTPDEVSIFFLGGSGILPGTHFEVNLNTDNSTSGVGTWNTVDAGKFQTVVIDTTNGPLVPEPSMTWLLAAGCLMIFAARRRRSLNL
jgi:hypothetical protein